MPINHKNTASFKSFKQSKYYAVKYKNYFHIYDKILKNYKNKKIKFIEIGIFSGGSLFMWKNFLGHKAEIIGVDINPEAKRFEKYGFKIFIGNQADPKFWKKIFKKIGKVDIILDDGGHTNYQQISTINHCASNINDNGKIIVEDTHCSYLKKKFYNPNRFSFINYVKKIIDDINTRYPSLKKFNYSLNAYIYSVEIFESIVCFSINKKLCKKNKIISNNKKYIHPDEMRGELSNQSILYKLKRIFNLKTNFTYIQFLLNNFKLKKFFH